ncbi:glycosyl hydrolase 115 family protein [uncultured Algibacter sp.]|uniref:glycosyl hydrolase 115 family protein n=1 Tax=uncultured Algibacter sp. TaxID=298659 RepID=UPI002613DD69|nr:glycosyl hydrolase 115 family protein [uncultured Algibacter sp.]
MFLKGLKIKLCIVMMLLSVKINAQKKANFPMVSNEGVASIVTDAKDAKVVAIASKMLADDVFKVTGETVLMNQKNAAFQIIAGTLGKSKLIDKFIAKQNIDVSKLKNKWETFSIQVVENPSEDIKKALVVIGSDRRATAYGLLEISRMIGVSPWEWWADATPNKKDDLVISVENKVYGTPSVKYRGIFLNDEDWGLQRWSALNYEPETGDIGPKTYAKVFELLLRLRANTIWPAMHKCTKAFYHYPENKKVADNYAIVIGSSHAEPMLCNINAEWQHESMGDYRYDTNSEAIKKLFVKRAKETENFEGIYTVGMRGEHDSPMIVGEHDTDSQVNLLEQVITDQRDILKKHSKKGVRKPQAFVPYKEVLHYYQSGLDLPEDITLVWTDDNYGYIRQLSNPEEQKRSGGAGVYYHTSYWGRPHDYLWLNSTNPVLMWEEMSKAYEFKSQDIWILNCGDIKPHEYNMELFLDMAWDMAPFKDSKAVGIHHLNWVKREFGNKHAQAINKVIQKYYTLAFKRRPEFMAWSQVEPVTKAGKTELTQFHYGDEVSKRIDAYANLIDEVNNIKSHISQEKQDAFYQLIYYPVIGASNLNLKWLYAYKNEFVASQGRQSAAFYATKSHDAFKRIQQETAYYNDTLKNGKWKHIMNMSPRHLPVFSEPTASIPLKKKRNALGIALESYQMEVNHNIINSYADVLPVFNAYTKNSYYVDVFLKDNGNLKWEAKPKADWITISKTSGTLNSDTPEERLWVTIDWDKVPKGENKKEAPLGHDYQLIPPSYKVNSAIDFISNNEKTTIGVSVFNPKLEALKNYKDFVEDKGFVSIYAENFSRKKHGTEAHWETFEGIGYTGQVSVALPRSANSESNIDDIIKNSPVLEYDFYTFNFGEANVYVQAIPTHAPNNTKGVKCVVAIDDAKPVLIDFETFGRSDVWKQNVLKNASVQAVKQIVNKAGKHTLKIWMVDPGVMIDQILIDLGGWKSSYAFPPETKM